MELKDVICIVEKDKYHIFEDYLISLEIKIRFYPCQIIKDEKILVVQSLLDLNYQDASFIGLVNIEQLRRKDDWINNHVKEIISFKFQLHFFDYSEGNIKIWQEKYGIVARHLPYQKRDKEINYLRQLLKDTPKQYDLAFIGKPIGKRILKVIKILKSLDITINIVEERKEQRDQEIAKCKALLNIHYNDTYNIFEEIRCNRWLLSGLTVISEFSANEVKFDNLISHDYYKLPLEIYKYFHPNTLTIGVAIPTWKKDLIWLKRCLDSIEKQFLKPKIVAISASTCCEADVCDYSNYSYPIKVITTIEKQNAATNRNIAAALLKDVDIISFFDSDDEMLPERLFYLAKTFSESKCDFVLHNSCVLTSYQDKLKIENRYYKNYPSAIIANPNHCGVTKDSLIEGHVGPGYISVSSSLWEKEKFRSEDNYLFWEDSEYARRLITKNYQGDYIQSQLAIYHNYPEKYEHFCELAKEMRINSKHMQSYNYTKEALPLSNKNNEYIIYYELSIIAYYTIHKNKGALACDKVLFSSYAPTNIIENTINNSIFYIEKILIEKIISSNNIIKIIPHKMDKFENSSPLISYKNGYLCTVFHKVADDYFYRFIYFDMTITISHIGKAFKLMDKTKRYFMLEDNNDILLIKSEKETYVINSNVVNEYLLNL